jgi:hypothetical protein
MGLMENVFAAFQAGSYVFSALFDPISALN